MANAMDPADRSKRPDSSTADPTDADLPLPQDPGGEEAGPLPDDDGARMTEDSLGIQHEDFTATERLDAVEARIEALRNDDAAGTPRRPEPADRDGATQGSDGAITSATDAESGDASRPLDDPAAEGPAGDPTAGRAGAADSGRVPDQGGADAGGTGGLGGSGSIGGSGRAPDGGSAPTT